MRRYFLYRLRYRLSKCMQWEKKKVADWDISYLKLWIKFLYKEAEDGVDINNITYPEENQLSSVKAKGLMFEDGQTLYIGFIAEDPEPQNIRAFLRDRDSNRETEREAERDLPVLHSIAPQTCPPHQ